MQCILIVYTLGKCHEIAQVGPFVMLFSLSYILMTPLIHIFFMIVFRFNMCSNLWTKCQLYTFFSSLILSLTCVPIYRLKLHLVYTFFSPFLLGFCVSTLKQSARCTFKNQWLPWLCGPSLLCRLGMGTPEKGE